MTPKKHAGKQPAKQSPTSARKVSSTPLSVGKQKPSQDSKDTEESGEEGDGPRRGRTKLSKTLESQAEACLEDFKDAGPCSCFFSEKGSPAFLRTLNRWIGAAAGKAQGSNVAKFEKLKKRLQIVEGCLRHYAKYRQAFRGQHSDFAGAFERLQTFRDKDPKVLVAIPPLMFRTFAEALANSQPTSVPFVSAIQLDKSDSFGCNNLKDAFYELRDIV